MTWNNGVTVTVKANSVFYLQLAEDFLYFISTDGYVKSNPRHRQLLMCLLMTSSDLSDQTKNWMTTKKIAVSGQISLNVVCHQFHIE